MARTVAECREILAAAESARKVLMVAHCRRFDEDWGTFERVYRSGQIGEQEILRERQQPATNSHAVQHPREGRTRITGNLRREH